MKTKRALQKVFATIILLSVASLAGCGGEELASTWCDREVSVDGLDAEWEGAMAYLNDENMAVGLLNDEDYLYLCLATVDSRVVRQVVGSGLTVWFDPQGGKKKLFGINFPLGMQFSRMDMDREKMQMPISRESMPDPEKLKQMVEESAKEMVILGPGKNEHRRMPVYGSEEIQVKLGYSGGKLVYELRVPLVRDAQHPDAIGLEDNEFVGIGFETAEMDMEMMRDRMREKMGGGMPSGGRGIRGGGMRGGGRSGGGRGGRGSRGGEAPHRLELWTKVELASENASAAE